MSNSNSLVKGLRITSAIPNAKCPVMVFGTPKDSAFSPPIPPKTLITIALSPSCHLETGYSSVEVGSIKTLVNLPLSLAVISQYFFR